MPAFPERMFCVQCGTPCHMSADACVGCGVRFDERARMAPLPPRFPDTSAFTRALVDELVGRFERDLDAFVRDVSTASSKLALAAVGRHDQADADAAVRKIEGRATALVEAYRQALERRS